MMPSLTVTDTQHSDDAPRRANVETRRRLPRRQPQRRSIRVGWPLLCVVASILAGCFWDLWRWYGPHSQSVRSLLPSVTVEPGLNLSVALKDNAALGQGASMVAAQATPPTSVPSPSAALSEGPDDSSAIQFSMEYPGMSRPRSFWLRPSDSVLQIKDKVSEMSGMEGEDFYLRVGSERLNDDTRCVDSFCQGDFAVVHAELRARGGSRSDSSSKATIDR